ncbi:L,D-transpeptidase [Corynebacterium doosanense]|uniref:L,D-TPase catalytic domain-containing protein n=1 Tax=Corynebacterium doosanense CAU 212 = DSM 45436 TaxID=558173 RepID=A0A097IDV8_9CORY|nr:L,D-transpeptidase [Corynebacterium doosanense]AIT60328.1 hypothetical protein CDOO_03000 [Corynebacterium doosanense CAU 212 = DSM 45436]
MSKNQRQAVSVRRRVAAVAASAAIAVTTLVTPVAAHAQALPDLAQAPADLGNQFQAQIDSIGQQTRDQAWNTRLQLNSQISSLLPQAQAAQFSALLDQAIEAAFPGLIAERTAPAPAPAPAPAVAPAPEPVAAPRVNTSPCPATADACVDLDGGVTWLQENGQITYGPVRQSPGKAATPTPRGQFYVTRQVKDEISREFNNAPMPYATYFTNNGHAFHAGTLDSRSAGCVRMNTADAAHYFETLNVGDSVFIF